MRKEHQDKCEMKAPSLGSADEQSDEDEAMEVNEDEPAHESDELVMSDDETPMQMPNIYTEARPADSDTCSAHSSQAELASLGYADDDTHEVEDVEESKDEPAANMKRVFITTRPE